MALNTLEKLYVALRDLEPRIELEPEVMERARVPLERMLEMAGRTVGQGDVGKPIIDTPEKIDPAISGDLAAYSGLVRGDSGITSSIPGRFFSCRRSLCGSRSSQAFAHSRCPSLLLPALRLRPTSSRASFRRASLPRTTQFVRKRA